jgi:hypothetical protein
MSPTPDTTIVLDGRCTAGRKGIPFDWQAIEAAAGVTRIEADLRDLTPALDRS